MDANPSWVGAYCFLLLNMYAMKNRQPRIGDFRLLTVVRDMQVYRRTVFMMIIGETMCWVRDIALQVTNFNVHHRGSPMLLQAWTLDKLSMIPPVPASSIPTYGPANFRTRSRGHFDFGDNPIDTNLPSLIHGTQGSKENNMKNPSVLPSGSITRSHAKKYRATMEIKKA
ncbi:hypothetical protein JCGZ_09965 [Jatropha curcas]|uniref:Aminotransferase-like plant mobile domain-containing protein n=1 Tax=Jatropha curcas TaxID=180498 RepID=A0A067KJF0_JATCU|nr:hypothetical protein JCGZ_09965 [Jatropha curcas]